MTAVIALAFISSCTEKEQEQETDFVYPEEEVGGGITEFTATLPATKTQLGDPTGADGSREWPNLWSNGDIININGVESAELSTGDGYVGTDCAIFEMASAVSGPYYAAYPSSAVSDYSNGSATITIPATQDWVEGNYDPAAYIMLGKSNTATLTFSPMMGLVQLTTTAPAEGTLYIKSISVESVGDEKMSGAFTTTTDYAGITGGDNTSITISAASGTTKAFGTVFTFAIPAQNYASGMRFRITAVPNADGTGAEQTMVFAKQSAFDVSAGTLYPLTAPAFKESAITVSCTLKTSSSLGLEWSGANASSNIKKPWSLAIYSDSGCNTLVVQHSIPADPDGTGVWKDQGGIPRFMVGGLDAGTTYYCKVTDINSNVSVVEPFTTESFTCVSASSPLGTTLVAEDFSEVGWGSAFLGGYSGHRYAGWAPVVAASAQNAISFAAPTGVVSSGYYNNYEFAVNNVNTNMDYNTVTRLRDGWGWFWEGGFNGYPQPGFLRMGGKNSNRSFVVCPALAISEGKYATVDVTVKVSHMNSGDASSNAAFAIFKETELTLDNSARRNYIYSGSLNALSHAYPLTLAKYGHDKDELTFRVNGVKNTDHLVFGLYKNVNEHNRYNLFSIKIERVGDEYNEEIFDITDVSSLDLFRSRVADGATTLKGNVINDIDASSIASSWTPIAGYTGTLSGNSKTITGLTKPFFADLQGDVDHLTLNSTINATTDTYGEGPAIFAQSLSNGGSLSYCTSQGSVTYQPSTAVTDATRYAAGLVAYVTDGSVTNCSNEASVSVPHNSQTNDLHVAVGGVVAKINDVSGSCSDLSNSGSVSVGIINATSTSRWISVGGVVGEICSSGGATVENLTNDGTVSLSGSATGEVCLGGVIGYGERTTTGCSNLKQVSYTGSSGGELYVGGVIGQNHTDDKTLSNSSNSGTILINSTTQTGQHIYIGGVAGKTQGKITATNSGEVTISRVACKDINLGGIVGLAGKGGIGNGTINESLGIISISNTSASAAAYIGGVAGRCYGSGSITANNNGSLTLNSTCSSSSHLYVGGIVGYTTRALSGCTNSGAITNNMSMTGSGKLFCIGGVAGRNAPTSTPNYVATITNCHNTVSVSNSASSADNILMGGISGFSNCKITSSTNTGDITNSGGSGNSNWIAIGGIVGEAQSDIESCSNGTSTDDGGTVSNSGTSASSICIGGVAGAAVNGGETRTFTSCYNTGAVSNTGVASIGDGETPGVRLGGVIGYADGAITLSGTSDAYNYNNGAISENSNSTHIAVSGVCAYSDNASSTFTYASNKSNGDITISNGNKDQLWVGGVLACGKSATVDHSSNAGDIVFDKVTVDQLWCGGIIGKWLDSATLTIQYCANSGKIKTKTQSWDNTKDLMPRSYSCPYSYIGGISGGGNDNTGKTYSNCTNSGKIDIYSPSKYRIGGITTIAKIAPVNCTVKADIRFKRNTATFQEEGQSQGTTGDSYVAGIVGCADLTSFSGLKYKGSIDTRSNNATKAAGIVAYQSGSKAVTFTDCTIGGSFKAAGSSNNMAGLFEQGTNNSDRNYSFVNCVIETGTIWDGDSVITINSQSDVTIKMCAGPNCKLTSGGSLPSVGSVTWPTIP